MAEYHYDDEEEEFQADTSTNALPIVIATMIIALALAAVYIMTHVKQEFDLLLEYGLTGDATTGLKANSHYITNLSNLGYLLQGVLLAAIPINFLASQRNAYFRTVVLKVIFTTMAVIYLLGITWVFKWIYAAIVNGGFDWNFIQFQRNNAYMFNHLCWASNNPMGIIFDLMAASCWLKVAHDMNNDHKNVYKSMIKTMVVLFAVPMLFFAIRIVLGKLFPTTFKSGYALRREIGLNSGVIVGWWYTKSFFLLLYYSALTFYFWFTSKNNIRYEMYTCAIGSFDEIKKRTNRGKNSTLNPFYKYKYYKREMEKDDGKIPDDEYEPSEHHHHHHHHSSHSHSDTHHSPKPKDWTPASGDTKTGIGDDERGSMGIGDILKHEDVSATMINTLPNSANGTKSSEILNRPGIARTSVTPKQPATPQSASVDELTRLQKEQQADIQKQLEQVQKMIDDMKNNTD